MSADTIHVVQCFRPDSGGHVLATEPKRFETAAIAIAAARILIRTNCGVVAWSSEFEAVTGQYGKAIELVRLGTIPEWFDEKLRSAQNAGIASEKPP